jgi:hypothetical protein
MKRPDLVFMTQENEELLMARAEAAAKEVKTG